ncbi:hypothetical protein TWF506_006132 [Arthrobotrys conoides]|uniref:Uncharacterized protein n=1 Tax=Arthrobotrys conoides TaxID=74498 RepID=A0AAN8PK65_9PEZI
MEEEKQNSNTGNNDEPMGNTGNNDEPMGNTGDDSGKLPVMDLSSEDDTEPYVSITGDDTGSIADDDSGDESDVPGSDPGMKIEPQVPDPTTQNPPPKPSGGYKLRSATLTKWENGLSRSRREVYKLTRLKKNEKRPIFHHILAPVLTTDAWYVKTSYGVLSGDSMFDFEGLAYCVYGERIAFRAQDSVYIPLRYIRFAVERNPDQNTNLYTGVPQPPDGRRVSKNYEVRRTWQLTKATNDNETELISKEDENVPNDLRWNMIQYKNSKEKLIPISDLLGELRNKMGLNGVPFRSETGNLYWGKAKVGLNIQKYHRDIWFRYFAAQGKHKTGGDGKSWRARYDDRDLKTPLLVQVLQVGKDRFEGQGYGKPMDFMENLVQAINTIYTSPKGSQRNNQLKIWTGTEKMDEYRLLSKNPFGLFQTYIHNDEIHNYMKEFEPGLQKQASKKVHGKPGPRTPVRSLPVPGEFEKSMDVYLNKVAENDDISDAGDGEDEEDKTVAEIEALLEQIDEIQGKETDWESNEVQMGDAPETNTNVQSIPTTGPQMQGLSLQGKSNEPAPAPQQKAETDRAIKIRNHFPAQAQKGWRYSSDKHGGIIISSNKIDKAKGTRKTQKSQKDVMGFSASQMAEHVFKWTPPEFVPSSGYKRRQMTNGMYIAEWLHLCAYSWGGLGEEEDPGNFESSQTVGNLVFGTSESNSCMTRYESSWQALFTDEAAIASKIGPNSGVNITGQLEVTRNHATGDIRESDERSPESRKYIWKDEPLPGNDNLLVNYAARAKLLAYTIFYQPRMNGPGGPDTYSSRILNQKSATTSESTVFHPFSRRFFHRAEYLLDSALYQAMYTIAAHEHLQTQGLADLLINGRFPYTNKHIKAVLSSRKHDPGAKEVDHKERTGALMQGVMKFTISGKMELEGLPAPQVNPYAPERGPQTGFGMHNPFGNPLGNPLDNPLGNQPSPIPTGDKRANPALGQTTTKTENQSQGDEPQTEDPETTGKGKNNKKGGKGGKGKSGKLNNGSGIEPNENLEPHLKKERLDPDQNQQQQQQQQQLGDPGFLGNQGFPGGQGYPGYQGNLGNQGYLGYQGNLGNQGYLGYQGHLGNGDQNQGYQNQGYQNQGYQNQGDQNQGDQNQGGQGPQKHQGYYYHDDEDEFA